MREYRRRKRIENAESRKMELPRGMDGASNPQKIAILREWSSGLVVPPGHPNSGKPMTIPEFALDFLADCLETPENLLCIARKNGKSAIIAVYLLARLASPIRIDGYRAGVASVTKEKAEELYLQCVDIIEANGLTSISARKAPKRLIGVSGRVDFLSADRSSGHASGFDDAIIDEIGLLKERDRELVNGMRSSVSARNGRFIALSIMGDAPFTKEIIERSESPYTNVHLYRSEDDCALDDREQWLASNPGLGTIKSIEYMESEAARVVYTPADQSSFRAFDLNQPGSPSRELICTVSDWQACTKTEQPPRAGKVILGLDMGGSDSMTAVVAIWYETGRVECWGAFGGVPDPKARGVKDGVGDMYLQMIEEGSVRIYDQFRVTPTGAFIRDVLDDLEGERIEAIGADRYRSAEVLQLLDELPSKPPVIFRGTGAHAHADGSYDVRAFQRAVKARTIAPKPLKIWASAILESEIRQDGNGNPALDKRRANGRIDVLQAGVIAAGLADLAKNRKPTQLELKIAV